MYIQIKKSNNTKYVYLVESFRKDDGTIGHRTLNKLGKLDLLLQDDPQALEKLKKEVKEKSAEIKGAIKKDVVTKLNSMAKSSRLKKYDAGLPQINYAYAVFRFIWTDILKLDYRFSYLQSRYYPKLKYSLSDTVLANIVISVLNMGNEETELAYGEYLGFLGLNYTAKELKENFENCKKILTEESMHTLRFIVKQLSAEYDMEFLTSTMTQSGFHVDSEMLQNMELDSADDTFGSDELVLNKAARFNMIFSYLQLIMMKIIKFRLDKKSGEEYDFDKIKNALREAIVLVDYPLVENESFLYIKRNNGFSAKLMNLILKAFDMSPILNVQDKTELGHRLHLKLKSENKIVPDYMMAKL